MRIPLATPDIHEADIEAVSRVLRTSRLSLGAKLGEFESAIAEYVGVPQSIAVSSGTSALHLCMRAFGIGEDDEVIVPSFAFIAVANAVRYERATPVFVDIEPRTLNLDPKRIETAITHRTRAIIVVHTFGCPADLRPILEIARRHRLYVVEDACEAIGAEYEGKKVGTLGDIGVFGFYPNKQITTGEGGAVVTENLDLAKRIRSLRNQGRSESGKWFSHSELGYNYRISEMNCALGCEQLKRIELILKRRDDIACEYHAQFVGNPDIDLPPVSTAEKRISWFAYVVRLSPRFSEIDRDHIIAEMSASGIELGRYFAPIHLQPPYKMLSKPASGLDITESISARVLALPFFNRIKTTQIEEVSERIVELSGKVARSSASPCG